jgi:hypothetical protein
MQGKSSAFYTGKPVSGWGGLVAVMRYLEQRGVRQVLANRVKQLVAFDGHIEVGAGGLSFANAFSHPHVQLRNVERKPRRDRVAR